MVGSTGALVDVVVTGVVGTFDVDVVFVVAVVDAVVNGVVVFVVFGFAVAVAVGDVIVVGTVVVAVVVSAVRGSVSVFVLSSVGSAAVGFESPVCFTHSCQSGWLPSLVSSVHVVERWHLPLVVLYSKDTHVESFEHNSAHFGLLLAAVLQGD